ncbi:MAG: amidase [Hyphomicrobiaceae bacterium]
MSARWPGLTIEETRTAIDKGELAIEEAVEMTLAALDGKGRQLNAVARLEREHAMTSAKQLAGSRKRGETVGPLFGVPLAHKDLYGRKGWLLEAGSKLMQGHRSPRTALAVAKLDAAGALDIARLNTVEFALGTMGHNEHTGPVQNPWNTAHITGGSSSGSGAAVAAGLVPAALGSDTGGSIRLPAAACGLVGLKPTAGLVGRSGVVPLSGSLDTVGPLTRTVRDAAIVLQAIAGPDADDSGSLDVDIPDYLAGIEGGAKGVRIGIVRKGLYDPVKPDVAARLDAAVANLGKLGASVREVEIEGIELVNRLTALMISVEAASLHSRWLAGNVGDYGRQTVSRLMAGLFVPGETYLRVREHRRRFARYVLDTALSEVDVLFAPVWPYPVPTIAETGWRAGPDYAEMVVASGHCTRPINYLGLPTVSLPCGFTDNGLPAAFQLIGRPFAEAELLRVARAYEREQPLWRERRPSVSVWAD